MRKIGFSLVELLAALGITAVLAAVLASASLIAYRKSSLAISANNLRQLGVGASSYLSENNYVFWKYRSADPDGEPGVRWWFGFEPLASFSQPRGATRLRSRSRTARRIRAGRNSAGPELGLERQGVQAEIPVRLYRSRLQCPAGGRSHGVGRASELLDAGKSIQDRCLRHERANKYLSATC